MKYIEVNTIEDATYWMALETSGSLTFGKMYKLQLRKIPFINTWNQNMIEEDYWIKDNNGEWFKSFELYKGQFVKLLN